MTKTLDILFKIVAFLWFGIVGFTISVIAYFLAFESNGDFETEPFMVLIGFSICAIIAFIFSMQSWKFYYKKQSTELLLDEIDVESEPNELNYFKNYLEKSFLAIVVGLSSVIFGVWFYSDLVKTVDDQLRFWILLLAVIVFCLFGLLLFHRGIDVWLKSSLREQIKESNDLKDARNDLP